MARWTYEAFCEEVEKAEAEVRREFPPTDVQVICRSVEALGWGSGTPLPPWGEFYPPNGPIVLYQRTFEENEPPDEGMEHQIREVLRHEFRHLTGHGDHEDKLVPRDTPSQPPEWYEDAPLTLQVGDVLVKLP